MLCQYKIYKKNLNTVKNMKIKVKNIYVEMTNSLAVPKVVLFNINSIWSTNSP